MRIYPASDAAFNVVENLNLEIIPKAKSTKVVLIISKFKNIHRDPIKLGRIVSKNKRRIRLNILNIDFDRDFRNKVVNDEDYLLYIHGQMTAHEMLEIKQAFLSVLSPVKETEDIDYGNMTLEQLFALDEVDCNSEIKYVSGKRIGGQVKKICGKALVTIEQTDGQMLRNIIEKAVSKTKRRALVVIVKEKGINTFGLKICIRIKERKDAIQTAIDNIFADASPMRKSMLCSCGRALVMGKNLLCYSCTKKVLR